MVIDACGVRSDGRPHANTQAGWTTGPTPELTFDYLILY